MRCLKRLLSCILISGFIIASCSATISFNSTYYHMKFLKQSIPFILLLASCKKHTIEPTTIAAKNQGYITVDCDNCQVAYGMPDQYRMFNVVSASPKAVFTYSTGYILQVFITSLDHQQKLTLNVYNGDGKSVYTNTATQPLTNYWGSSVLLN